MPTPIDIIREGEKLAKCEPLPMVLISTPAQYKCKHFREDKLFVEFMALISEGHEAVINKEEVEEYHAKVKSFIKKTLLSHHTLMLTELEGAMEEMTRDEGLTALSHKSLEERDNYFYNLALDSVLEIIRKYKQS